MSSKELQLTNQAELKFFHYEAELRLVLGADKQPFKDKYPGATTLALSSREFRDFNDCVISGKALLDGFKDSMADVAPDVKIGSETNPDFSGQPSLSKDWAINEVARIWLIDNTVKGANLTAYGKVCIFGSNRSIQETTFF
jgi:hypothetical protein